MISRFHAGERNLVIRNLDRLTEQLHRVELVLALGDFLSLGELVFVDVLKELHILENCVILVKKVVLESLPETRVKLLVIFGR